MLTCTFSVYCYSSKTKTIDYVIITIPGKTKSKRDKNCVPI